MQIEKTVWQIEGLLEIADMVVTIDIWSQGIMIKVNFESYCSHFEDHAGSSTLFNEDWAHIIKKV